VVFIGPGEHCGGVAGVNAGINGSNAIEDGGGGVKRGIKGGEMMAGW
jgi:hypothetical protein